MGAMSPGRRTTSKPRKAAAETSMTSMGMEHAHNSLAIPKLVDPGFRDRINAALAAVARMRVRVPANAASTVGDLADDARAFEGLAGAARRMVIGDDKAGDVFEAGLGAIVTDDSTASPTGAAAMAGMASSGARERSDRMAGMQSPRSGTMSPGHCLAAVVDVLAGAAHLAGVDAAALATSVAAVATKVEDLVAPVLALAALAEDVVASPGRRRSQVADDFVAVLDVLSCGCGVCMTCVHPATAIPTSNVGANAFRTELAALTEQWLRENPVTEWARLTNESSNNAAIASISPDRVEGGAVVKILSQPPREFTAARPERTVVMFAPAVPGTVRDWSAAVVSVQVPDYALSGPIYFSRIPTREDVARTQAVSESLAAAFPMAYGLSFLSISSPLGWRLAPRNRPGPRLTIPRPPTLRSFKAIDVRGNYLPDPRSVRGDQPVTLAWEASDDGSTSGVSVTITLDGKPYRTGLPLSGSLAVRSNRDARCPATPVHWAVVIEGGESRGRPRHSWPVIRSSDALLGTRPVPRLTKGGNPPGSGTTSPGTNGNTKKGSGSPKGGGGNAPPVTGPWTGPLQLSLCPVHAAVLNDGSVLYFSYDGDYANQVNATSTNPGSASPKIGADFSNPNDGLAQVVSFAEDGTPLLSSAYPTQRNLFCAGQCMLPDGRIFAPGGQIWAPAADKTSNWWGMLESLASTSDGAAFLAEVVGFLVTNLGAAAIGVPGGLIFGGLLGGPIAVILGVLAVDEAANGSQFSGTTKDVHVFDPTGTDLTRLQPDMSQGRYYPTCAVLPNGSVFVAGGLTNLYADTFATQFLQLGTYGQNETFETFNGTTLSPPSNFLALDNYPIIQVLPLTSFLFVHSDDTTWLYDWEDGTFLADENGSPITFTTPRDSTGNTAHITYPAQTGAVLLPFVEGGEIQIFVAGGAPVSQDQLFLQSSLPQDVALQNTHIFTFNPANPASSFWTEGPPMTFPRVLADTVLLPDGTVLIINGVSAGLAESSASPVYTPEIFDPSTGSITRLTPDPTRTPRKYHSNAVLLRDGRVMVAGNTGMYNNNPPVVVANGDNEECGLATPPSSGPPTRSPQ
jgi:hypothetical protein